MADSYQLTSCKPEPVCQHLSTDFNDLSRVLMNGTKYDGNATAYDWVGASLLAWHWVGMKTDSSRQGYHRAGA